MYDYNFPESLTAEQLTILLMSLVIPTDIVVLKQSYKKKKFSSFNQLTQFLSNNFSISVNLSSTKVGLPWLH